MTKPNWGKLSTKIVGALLGFLALALMVIGTTLYLSWQLEGSAAAINEAGSLRMQAYRMAMLTVRAADDKVPPDLERQVGQRLQAVDATMLLLKTGDPQRPLFLPPTPLIQLAFYGVQQQWTRSLQPAARRALAQGHQADWPAFRRETDAFVASADALVGLVERDSETRTFWLRASQLALLAMALAGTVSITYLMFIMIVDPVTRLSDSMRRMKEADFAVRVPVESKDEFGQMAQGFNDMADRLQALYGSLEERVQSKTATLEAQNRELALLYDSAAFLQTPLPVEALCDGFLQRLRSYFRADGGSVRVLDEKRGNLHMVAHQGISDELVETEHCLKVGDCLCGEAVEKKISVVHDLRKIDKAQELQCHREGFATVSVFHINARQQHLGFFNMHFTLPKKFSKREYALLETLGQLLGVAIENQRLAAREREMAVSEERNLVAQGLHDSIAQGLNFLNLQVQMLDDSVREGKAEEVRDIVPALRAGVQDSYEDVRELLLNFRQRLMEDNLVGSIEATVDKFRRLTGIEAELVADIDGAPFPREQQLQLLFIVQEALSNIRKHACASKVEVRLEDRQDFTLTVRDDGKGFDSANAGSGDDGHVGIHIMQERAQRIEAQLSIQSQPGAGTTVRVQLPQALRRAA